MKGGLFYRAGSLSAMLDFARAIIWPHFDSLMAITGAGGANTSAFYSVADECIRLVGMYFFFISFSCNPVKYSGLNPNFSIK